MIIIGETGSRYASEGRRGALGMSDVSGLGDRRFGQRTRASPDRGLRRSAAERERNICLPVAVRGVSGTGTTQQWRVRRRRVGPSRPETVSN